MQPSVRREIICYLSACETFNWRHRVLIVLIGFVLFHDQHSTLMCLLQPGCRRPSSAIMTVVLQLPTIDAKRLSRSLPAAHESNKDIPTPFSSGCHRHVSTMFVTFRSRRSSLSRPNISSTPVHRPNQKFVLPCKQSHGEQATVNHSSRQGFVETSFHGFRMNSTRNLGRPS